MKTTGIVRRNDGFGGVPSLEILTQNLMCCLGLEAA